MYFFIKDLSVIAFICFIKPNYDMGKKGSPLTRVTGYLNSSL